MQATNSVFSGHIFRQSRRARLLKKMAAMRAAKERKRLDSPPPDREPNLRRFFRYEFGVRDRITGEIQFTELRSVRQASTALGLILKHLQ